MAGRQLRHEFLAKTSREIGIPVVATAHHADDQVELLLLRLLRGGGAGLSGMPWSNPSPADDSVRIVRPFLDQPKDILTHYAKTHELEFREDASNQSTDILRNRIRHELVPLMRTYELAFSTNALRTMEIIGTNEDFIKGKAVEWRKRRRKPSFLNLNPAVQRQIVRLQLLEMGIIPGFEIVEALRQWPDRAVTVRPRRSIACNRDGIVADSLTGSINFNPRQLGLKMSKPRGRAEFNGLTFNWQIHIGGSVRPRCQRGMSMCEWFDAGRVGDRVILRHWQPGDRFQPIGMCKAVKLQDLFTNQKVPRKKRVTLVVATTWSGAIFWVEGLRIGEEFKLRTDTTRTLRWRWSPRKGD
jgi:tRNA(Ile)-lysidine synthase